MATQRRGDCLDLVVWGDSELIAVDPKTGELSGGQDHRHHFGKAAGF